ncbi:putative zinc finger protein, partial [Orchesella cincta]
FGIKLSQTTETNGKLPKINKERKQKHPVVLPDNISVHTEEGSITYHCQICSRSFKTKANVKYHFSCKTGIKLFNCELYHQRAHAGLRTFECKICRKDFVHFGHLTRHVVLVHGDTRPYKYQCQMCPKAFQSKQGLKAHLICHKTERPFTCQQCIKKFKSRGALKSHTRINHGEQIFKCNECGKGFGAKETLNMHLIVHFTARPYVCNECQFAFKRKKELDSHAAVHTALFLTGERNYKCEICKYSFARKATLQRHQKSCKQVVKVMKTKAAAAVVGKVNLNEQPTKVVKVITEKAGPETGRSKTGEIGQTLQQAPLTTCMLSSYDKPEGLQNHYPRCGCWVCSQQRLSRLYEQYTHFISDQRTRGFARLVIPFPVPVPVPMNLESATSN